jgi:hypothetical protein
MRQTAALALRKPPFQTCPNKSKMTKTPGGSFGRLRTFTVAVSRCHQHNTSPAALLLFDNLNIKKRAIVVQPCARGTCRSLAVATPFRLTRSE